MNNIKIFVSGLLLLVFSSCDSFLELKPASNISTDLFNNNAEELFVSLTGCYNGMQGALYREWAVTELRSDNSRIYTRNSSTSIFAQIKELDLCEVSTINYIVDEYWSGNYTNIDRCNVVLRDLNVVDNEDLQNEYKGEAKFIRAYHYFNMVQLFGGVFLVTEPIRGSEARVKQRSTPDDIYNFIEAELQEIIDDDILPDIRPNADLGRISMLAVKSLLAKVYMTRYPVGSSGYASAKPLLEDVIRGVGDPQSAADLVPFESIFDINNEMNKEIIFAVRYKSGNMGIGSPFANQFAPSNSGDNVVNGSGSSFNYPSNSIIDAFNAEPDDLRKDITMAEKYFNEITGAWVDDDDNSHCRFVKKYLSPVKTVNDAENDWPVIRVADILLLYAELVNELEGPTARAVGYVDMIRERAGLAPLEAGRKSNSYNFRRALRNERRLELAFENHRWFDLMRWGIAAHHISDHFEQEPIYKRLSTDVDPIVDWQTILPIPFNVININPELPQNIGY